VDNKASSIIVETKEIQIRRKPASPSSYMPNSAVDTHTLYTPNLLCYDIYCFFMNYVHLDFQFI
jgi:hypothetical protein